MAAAGFLFSGPMISAQDVEKLPKELEALKFRYEVEVTRVLDPVQKNYLEALDDLLRRYTEAGNLEAVMKTREESGTTTML